ncbi:GTP 3',8-cyclase MoaA [Acidithiobacillus ferridurans]|uniref:GTP 3',8-cyclase MoaA n=1 Tax=Acidithiobacillus ferridurans TaxID=1232575 RepID=UPI001C0763DC|nr:GTP 3',8-cyclase MoaA [Acidithiobacillus ferridurans]MBU2732987.1 GTP 3',8-cyclase MoaA [Acidithiobacillus ferridurans]
MPQGLIAEPAQWTALTDQFGRRVSYLRISVTEHCNFRCSYCSPEEGTPFFVRKDHLQAEEYDRLIRIFSGLGVRHIRFTGGEPLLHPQILSFVGFARRHGVGKISISTNGVLLGRRADALKQMGVNNLNVSLDSLDPEVFARVTRGGDVRRVLEGIDAAIQAKIPRIKLNVVLLRQDNGDSLPALLEYAIQRGVDIRFIEAMPLGEAGADARETQFLSAAEAQQVIERHFGPLQPVVRPADNGPARLYQLPAVRSQVGFITPISSDFCATCNRVRLTATGRLVYCLGQDGGLELLPLLRGAASDGQIAEAIIQGIWRDKPEHHHFVNDPNRSARVFMMRLGG